MVEWMPSFATKTQLLRTKLEYKMEEITWDLKSREEI